MEVKMLLISLVFSSHACSGIFAYYLQAHLHDENLRVRGTQGFELN